MVIGDNKCNDPSITVFDLRKYQKLQRVRIGNDCFMYVKRVNFIGFPELVDIHIGKRSFTENKTGWGGDPARIFFLRGCPKVDTLYIDSLSFSDYYSCIIEDDPSLAYITIGTSQGGTNFPFAPLELKRMTLDSL